MFDTCDEQNIVCALRTRPPQQLCLPEQLTSVCPTERSELPFPASGREDRRAQARKVQRQRVGATRAGDMGLVAWFQRVPASRLVPISEPPFLQGRSRDAPCRNLR